MRTEAIGLPGLYALRVTRGLTRADIADAMGCSYHSVYAWEERKHSPNLRNLVKLCRLFHTTPNDLLGFADNDAQAWMAQANDLIAAHVH